MKIEGIVARVKCELEHKEPEIIGPEKKASMQVQGLKDYLTCPKCHNQGYYHTTISMDDLRAILQYPEHEKTL